MTVAKGGEISFKSKSELKKQFQSHEQDIVRVNINKGDDDRTIIQRGEFLLLIINRSTFCIFYRYHRYGIIKGILQPTFLSNEGLFRKYTINVIPEIIFSLINREFSKAVFDTLIFKVGFKGNEPSFSSAPDSDLDDVELTPFGLSTDC